MPVEQIVDALAPLTVEEVLGVPKVIQRETQSRVIVEDLMDLHLPQEQEELVHVPTVHVQHQPVDQSINQIVDVLGSLTVEEALHAPKVTLQERQSHFIVDLHVPQERKELANILTGRVQHQPVDRGVNAPFPATVAEVPHVPKVFGRVRSPVEVELAILGPRIVEKTIEVSVSAPQCQPWADEIDDWNCEASHSASAKATARATVKVPSDFAPEALALRRLLDRKRREDRRLLDRLTPAISRLAPDRVRIGGGCCPSY